MGVVQFSRATCWCHGNLGGGNSNIFYFHLYLGNISNLTHIFQTGWFNHQPVIVFSGQTSSTHLQDEMTQQLRPRHGFHGFIALDSFLGFKVSESQPGSASWKVVVKMIFESCTMVVVSFLLYFHRLPRET